MFLTNFYKFGLSRQIFVKVPNTKFQGNSSSRSCPDSCWQKNRHDEGSRRWQSKIKTMSAKYIFISRKIPLVSVISRWIFLQFMFVRFPLKSTMNSQKSNPDVQNLILIYISQRNLHNATCRWYNKSQINKLNMKILVIWLIMLLY